MFIPKISKLIILYLEYVHAFSPLRLYPSTSSLNTVSYFLFERVNKEKIHIKLFYLQKCHYDLLCTGCLFVSALQRSNSITSKRKVSSVSSDISEQEPSDDTQAAGISNKHVTYDGSSEQAAYVCSELDTDRSCLKKKMLWRCRISNFTVHVRILILYTI